MGLSLTTSTVGFLLSVSSVCPTNDFGGCNAFKQPTDKQNVLDLETRLLKSCSIRLVNGDVTVTET